LFVNVQTTVWTAVTEMPLSPIGCCGMTVLVQASDEGVVAFAWS